ncbi:TonB-dependent receptor [Sphingosinicella sp. LHD-64]|uniref:TonB-dependent receptor n=1 Tax=Sphingosinicella sp. LHD-64 TaxID=3072139 RepID=UPI00280C9477|nr:TonB-dependent receptor [Sphingosinicella sp. LHD-64]MDQ8755183.1 TonB-dependent receptor [Sphingosinicella sp. LHD-64]
MMRDTYARALRGLAMGSSLAALIWSSGAAGQTVPGTDTPASTSQDVTSSATGDPAAPGAESVTAANEDQAPEDIVITGYRRSLEDAIGAKRRNTNFTDSIFAEDIGKFPDLNLAESLQRLPGIQIERDAAGEGTRVNVRGLGSQFTVLSMNGAQLQTASDNSVGFINDGRGSSLDIFPTELFRSLTISKTPLASQIEGGIAGNVELAPIRPFDNRGFQISVQAQGSYQDVSEQISPRVGAFVSNTWETGIGEIGLLIGAAYAEREYRSDTFNTVGFTTFALGNRCPAGQVGCNSLNFDGAPGNPTVGYGGGASIPTTVPVGTGFGLVDGAPLVPCGPGSTPGGTSGLSCEQLSYTLIPRLGRAEVVVGKRTRTSGLVTAQWAPVPEVVFNLDTIYAETANDFNQNDLMLTVRSTGNNVPIDFEVNEDNILTSGTFANAQLLSENRPYSTRADFFYTSFGMNYEVSDLLRVRAVLTYNKSKQRQSANTILLRTPLGRGYAVDFEQTGDSLTPIFTPNFDVNDPGLGWIWDTLRVQPNRRWVEQKDVQVHLQYGDEDFMVSAGAQVTRFERTIETWDVSACATNAVNGFCGPTSTQPSAFPGALASIPNSQLGNYMVRWPYGQLFTNSPFNVGFNGGWAIPDYDAIADVINIDYFENEIDPVTRLNTLNPRQLNETTAAVYLQLDGQTQLAGRPVRFNLGIRGIRTDQFVSGIVTDPTVGRTISRFDNDYFELLPSFNASIDVLDNVVFRVAAGRTMTRPNPGDLAPAFNLSLGGEELTLGNPELEPYFSNQLDLGLEWYMTPRSVIAVNFWMKQVTGFTSIFRTQQRFGELGINFDNLLQITRDGLTVRGDGDPNAAIVTVAQRQNTDEVITLRGFEVTLVQPLDFILPGLGINANYTRIDQESEGAPEVAGNRLNPGAAVVGLSPNTYNVTVYFERDWISARMSYNYRDPFVSFLGPQNNVEGDGVSIKGEYLDASISFPIPGIDNIRVSLQAQNLLNEIQLQQLDGDSLLPYGAYAPGRTFVFGLTGRF